MLLRAGEVDEVRPGLPGRHDHQVHLGAVAQLDRRLVGAGVDHLGNPWQGGEAADQPDRIVGLGEEVEVADRLAPAAKRAGRDELAQPRAVAQRRLQLVDEPLRGPEKHPALARLEPGDPVEDRLLALLREPADRAQATGLGRPPELLETLDAERLVQDPDRLRADARNVQKLEQSLGDLRPEAVVEAEPAGPDDLVDLLADRLADARDLGRPALAIGAGDLERAVRDRVGGAVVGDRLEHELALDLEHVADLVEDPRQLVVRGQRRRGGRRGGRRLGRGVRGHAIGGRGGVRGVRGHAIGGRRGGRGVAGRLFGGHAGTMVEAHAARCAVPGGMTGGRVRSRARREARAYAATTRSRPARFAR